MKNDEIENQEEFEELMAIQKAEWSGMSPGAQKERVRFVMENTNGRFFWYLEAMGEDPDAWHKKVLVTEHPDSPESLMADIEAAFDDDDEDGEIEDEDESEDFLL